jgi:sugar-specific transcriptional regulator TrmB
LLQHHPATGYEVAKFSNIPRPNIYPVLQKLESRGAALRIAGGEAARYIPVPPAELLKRLGDQFQTTLNKLEPALQAVAAPISADYICTAQGYSNLLAQARSLIRTAQAGLLIALWPDEARALGDELAQAEGRELPVTTLCLAACPQECSGCRGRIYRNKVIETPGARWLLLVRDDQEVLVGEIPANHNATLVRTQQALLVKLTGWFIRHAAALGVLLADAGDYLEDHLAPETRALLADVTPHGPQDWLAYMRQLLNSKGGTTDGN